MTIIKKNLLITNEHKSHYPPFFSLFVLCDPGGTTRSPNEKQELTASHTRRLSPGSVSLEAAVKDPADTTVAQKFK